MMICEEIFEPFPIISGNCRLLYLSAEEQMYLYVWAGPIIFYIHTALVKVSSMFSCTGDTPGMLVYFLV
jgi:hypothetical protein